MNGPNLFCRRHSPCVQRCLEGKGARSPASSASLMSSKVNGPISTPSHTPGPIRWIWHTKVVSRREKWKEERTASGERSGLTTPRLRKQSHVPLDNSRQWLSTLGASLGERKEDAPRRTRRTQRRTKPDMLDRRKKKNKEKEIEKTMQKKQKKRKKQDSREKKKQRKVRERDRSMSQTHQNTKKRRAHMS